MHATPRTPSRVWIAGLLSSLLFAGVLGGLLPVGVAHADTAPLDPASAATPATVAADALPTVQINGVAWSQVVVGNTVYVAGDFSTARPAGAPAGTQETVRNNLLAYDVRTGELITSFVPDLNGKALVVTASPDGSRIYVGGDFDKANGQTRYRVAAYSTATGELISNFRPSFNARVYALAATDEAVYAGGSFTAVGSTSRERLAAVAASNGALLPWAPVPGVGSTDGNDLPRIRTSTGQYVDNPQNAKTSNIVLALVVTGGGDQVVAAGRFDTLNGTRSTGVGALDPVTGATRPFAIGQLLTNQGVNSAIYSLSTDGANVYGTGYDYYGPGNLEGSFGATADGGVVQSINDCHGDSYSSFPANGALYVASHAHVCSNIGGFPETTPQTKQYATAVTTAAVGTVGSGTIDAARTLMGKPAASLLSWFPTFTAGTYTGQSQAGWSVSGNDQYIVYGGEFPKVNGTAQQGLVRFAVPSIAPNRVGPASAGLTPAVVALSAGTARVSWTTSHDRDNENLSYRVYRDGDMTDPVHEVTRASTFWSTSSLAFVDTGLSGGEHTYRVSVTDPMGNRVTSGWVPVEVAAGGPSEPRPYAQTVVADGAQDYWPLGERSGSIAYDHAGGSDLAVGSGVSLDQPGALSGDPDTSFGFGGQGLAATTMAIPGPDTFTVEAWFTTTSRSGGKVVGFGNRNTGDSTSYDRHVYLDGAGRVVFGVYPGSQQTISSSAGYNDGAWHHVVASLSPAGMALYLDGQAIGTNPAVTTGEPYRGYWRIGGDSSWGGTGKYLTGQIDEVAIYPSALSADVVTSHHTLGATGKAINVAPVASFTSSATFLEAAFDASASADRDGDVVSYEWELGDGATATGPTTTHTYSAAGTYPVTLTVTDDDGARSVETGTVTVTAQPANVGPSAVFSSSVAGLVASFDGAGSADPDGAVASYAWDFGDGATGAGAAVEHTYAEAGAYQVVLTVTDDGGATGRVEQSVTVSAPAEPSVPEDPEVPAGEPLAVDGFERTVASGLGQAETGGAWWVSGGVTSVSEGAASLEVPKAGGSSSVWLNSVSVQDVALETTFSLEQAPTGGGTYAYVTARRTPANFYRGVLKFLADGRVTVGVSRVVANKETTLRSVTVPGLTYVPGTVLRVRLDVSGSGTTTLDAKVWVDGTAEPADWQVSATDDTAELQAAGGVGVSTYVSGSATAVPVRMRVDDFWAGPAGTAPAAGETPAEPANVGPSAVFSSSVAGLVASFDGAGSADPDGAVASYAWDFGDGATGAGAAVEHTYAEAGAYQVVLTVTDDGGATGRVEQSVTVSAPAEPSVPEDPEVPAGEPLAVDGFERTVASGLGQAETGGAWWVSGGVTSVSEGAASLEVPKAGGSSSVWLNSVSVQDVALETTFSLEQAPTGGGTYAYVTARRTPANFYRGVLKFLADGRVTVGVSRVVANKETTLRSVTVPGLTYVPGTVLRVRLDVSGSGTTTLDAKVWVDGTAEPADWQVSATDDTAELQAAGGVGVSTYVSGSATAVPVRMRVDDFWAGPAGTAPAAA
ncbi:PKD domain-containing protein [Modestobacter sp. VKM Ac-2983]|uniref:PKD domain-containing protein n=1 Tax=Modestobacter sp. VKM Ac-2983 TaxID=3004137 RepID=UPI0022AB5E9D|nr:PKD domain-containing protein [Modestobacter sp. VKM Ac-2983]MCZ2804097.1 PKD domain-containing protein [Modestobacter sp. VKM Ac-2983]